MAKDKLTEYSATNASNDVLGDISVAEGMLPSAVNNAIREQMTHLKNFADGTDGINVLSLEDDDGSHAVKLQAPSTVSTTVTYTLPGTDGTSGYVLTTNGSGALSWAASLSNVVEDTSPQLGGNLDTNGNDITGTGNLNLTGTVTADGLTVDGNKIGISNAAPASVRSSDTVINMQDSFVTVGATNINLSHNVFHNGTNWVRSTTDSVGHLQIANNQLNFFNSTSDTAGTTVTFTKRMNINGGGDISFYADNGTTQGLFWDASTQRLGLGTTTPGGLMEVKVASGQSGATQGYRLVTADGGGYALYPTSAVANPTFLHNVNSGESQAFGEGGTAHMTIKSGGSVGIGIASPSNQMHLYGTSPIIRLEDSAAGGQYARINGDGTIGALVLEADSGGGGGSLMNFKVGGAERMRIDASGNLLVATTSLVVANSASNNGYVFNTNGELEIGSTSRCLTANRQGSDGDVIRFQKDGTTVGSIGVNGDRIYLTNAQEGIMIDQSANNLSPTSSTGTFNDNAMDLGESGNRWKDLYLSGSATIEGTSTFGTSSADTRFNFDGPNQYRAVFKSGGTVGGQIGAAGADDLRFSNAAGSTTASIKDGNLLVGTTISNYSATSGFGVIAPAAATYAFVSHPNGTASGTSYFLFSYNGGAIGSISQNGTTAVSYNTSSDRRLKSNIQDAASASDKIDALQVRQFDWNVDGSHQDYGLIAQELQPIEPLAVSGNADSDEMMGVDYSKLVPMLIKEIQELRGRVAALEAN